MKLQRQSIKLGSEYRGKWNFCICDKNPEELERVEEVLCQMEAPFTMGGVSACWSLGPVGGRKKYFPWPDL